MKQLLSIEIPYPSLSGNHTTRHGGGAHYMRQEALDYRLAVKKAVEKARAHQLRLAGPIELRWVLAPPDVRRRDQTNVLKPAEDALVKAGVLLDDSNEVIRRTVVDWVDPVPGGLILVEAIEWSRQVKP